MLEYILGDMMDSLKIKIVFFDIDGTLTNSNKVMSENTINTLNKLIEKNIFIVLCSGRANSYIKQYLKLINKSKYSISNNGALIYDNDLNKIIISHTLYSKDLEYLWNYSNETKSSFIINTINNKYSNNFVKNKKDKIIVDKLSNVKEDKVQLVISNDDINIMKELEMYINNKTNLKVINKSFDYLNEIKDGYYFFDVVNKNVSKGNAINDLLKVLNINKKNSLCFGDSINDIDMFKSVGISVAMANAIEDLKNIADYITDTNDEDGISKFFDKYL